MIHLKVLRFGKSSSEVMATPGTDNQAKQPCTRNRSGASTWWAVRTQEPGSEPSWAQTEKRKTLLFLSVPVSPVTFGQVSLLVETVCSSGKNNFLLKELLPALLKSSQNGWGISHIAEPFTPAWVVLCVHSYAAVKWNRGNFRAQRKLTEA